MKSGMTLLEVILAMGIALVLGLAIYGSVVIQYAQAEVGREKASRGQIVRGVLGQMQRDMRNVFTGWRPVSKDAAAESDPNDEVTNDDDDSSEPAQTSTTPSSTANPSEYEVPTGGILGFADAITLIVRRTPAGLEIAPNALPSVDASPVSDLRLVRYWYGVPGTDSGDSRTGLVRQELEYVPDVTAGDDPASGAVTEIIAEEIQSVAFRYFDGYGWVDEWDNTRDQTPQAVEVVIGMRVDAGRNAQVPNGPAIGTVPSNSEELRLIHFVVASQDVAVPDESSAGQSSGGTP